MPEGGVSEESWFSNGFRWRVEREPAKGATKCYRGETGLTVLGRSQRRRNEKNESRALDTGSPTQLGEPARTACSGRRDNRLARRLRVEELMGRASAGGSPTTSPALGSITSCAPNAWASLRRSGATSMATTRAPLTTGETGSLTDRPGPSVDPSATSRSRHCRRPRPVWSVRLVPAARSGLGARRNSRIQRQPPIRWWGADGCRPRPARSAVAAPRRARGMACRLPEQGVPGSICP
jgi:hypothetical protein